MTPNFPRTALKERLVVSPAKVSFGAQATKGTQGWVRDRKPSLPWSLIDATGQRQNEASDPAEGDTKLRIINEI